MMDAKIQKPRYALLDAVRGAAILLMIVYHFSWDLTFFGLADFRIFTDLKWIWFANLIVCMILGVMGVAQVMARRRNFNVRAFCRRFALIAGSAGLVSLVTYWMDPGTYIFFGILHHIAVASVIVAGLIYLPSLALLSLTGVLVAGPVLFVHPIFAADQLLWLGLSPAPPISVDYVPLVPWLAVPLLGILAGRWIVRREAAMAALNWNPAHPLGTLLCLAGRHSLAIYLIHQPILYGGLYLYQTTVSVS
ncbi:MAG: DUF1624 domain-containing protein [Rhodospirillaceae bacterium]|jgi:uncharacterized membrane protein|nr:DUF1624 domain-containing protein [Rhodospirillaceae bacterium]MBT4491417.1 DUF1624 domain-containing protein [Rhodospirillaceae bacterium]MBT5195909.1 DUF1624 domain-containing protein [Rhodospirillaceae bacterium]MBT5898619.1 DUF1624 domain-containing protein [Rhodospirillaceae bacterium]MBT6428052.1 DUF1624 domain-containing protein [Rhodospirillaceae bacterium]